MKQRSRAFFRKGQSLLLTLCIILSMIFVGNVRVSANPIAEKAVDQLIDDGMRICCMGLDWLGEATGNEDVQKAFSFVESWAFMSSEEIAIEELKELCEQILAELEEIEQEMTACFALINSILARDEIRTAKMAVDSKWTATVDTPIKNANATNALNAYKTFLADAVNEKDEAALNTDIDALITAFSGMYGENIPIEMNTPEKLRELIFRDGKINTVFTNLISELADGLNYDSLTNGSVSLYAAQFAYKAYPFSHQQYQYLHAVMEKQIMTVMLVEMMYNEYLYQQGEYLKQNFGEDSDQYRGYLGYQTSFYNLMTQGDSCVNSKIARMLDTKMSVDELGRVKLSLSDYMKPEDAVPVAMSVKDYESSIDYKQDVKDEGVMTNKIQDGSNLSKSKYIGSTLIFNRVMTHTASGNHIYYILDPSQFNDTYEAMAVKNLDHKVAIRLDSDMHTPTCDYINLTKDMSDGINTFRMIDDVEMTEFAPLFDTNYFFISDCSAQSYLNSTTEYLPHIKSAGSNENGFTKVYLLSSLYTRTHWAPAITSYTKYKALDGSKVFASGEVKMDSGWDSDILYTGSDDFKANAEEYGYSVILSNNSSTYKQNVTASVFRDQYASITVKALDGKSVSAGESMTTECGKELDIVIDGKGTAPKKLTLTTNGNTITIAEKSEFENLQQDENGFYHIKYSMPYSSAEFTLYMPEDTQTVSIGSFTNCTASLDKNKSLDKARYSYGEKVNVYIRAPKGNVVDKLEVVDNSGNLVTYTLYLSSTEDTGDETLYTYQFYMNYTRDLIVNGECSSGITISMDTDKFIRDTNDYLKAYIQLEDYDTKTFYDEPLVVSSMYNTVYGRYIFDDDYMPTHMKVVGLSTGTVFYDKDVSGKKSGDTFMLMNQLMATEFMPFGEDVIVIPTFSPNDPKVTLDDFRGCSASFEQSTSATERRFAKGDTVTFYLRVPAEYENIEITAVDNEGSTQTLSTVGEAVQDGAEKIITYQFTMPSTDVIVCGEAYKGEKKYTATITSFTGGVPSFTTDSVAVIKKFAKNEHAVFYVRAAKDLCFTELSVTDRKGKDIFYQKAADNVVDGDEIVYTIGFVMPASDVTISGKMEQGFTAAVDSSAFIYNDSGEPEEYIELKEYSTDTYSSDSVNIPSYVNTIEGRFVCGEGYAPSHIRITGEQTGTVFYDKDVTSERFLCMTADLSPYGENILVTPSFEKKDSPEPVDREYGIRTYEELTAFALNVKNDYANYGKANVWLENNILAPDDSKWTVAIGSTEAPFEGTFDGKGYGIVGLNVDIDGYGGLFGSIGENGTVKDLAVIDCDFARKSEYAGGIAAENNGTIDHCMSGINLDSSIVIYGRNGKKLRLDQYNSYIKGTYSGGIAAVNNGTITGTRNGSFVDGANCGGIAEENNGTIYGCANNGAVGRDSVTVLACGGITCINNGTIKSSYNSGKPTGSSSMASPTDLAMVAVDNSSSDVSGVFCHNVNSIDAIGTGADIISNGSITVMKNTDMLLPSFADKLNSVTDDSVQWAQKSINGTYLNSMYPIILGNFLKDRTLALSNGIRMQGMMHDSLNVSCSSLDRNDEVFEAINEAIEETDDSSDLEITAAYGVSCDDGNGVYIPADYWCSGVTVSVPVEEEDVSVAVMGSDGSVQIIEPERVEAGVVTFEIASPVSFAIVRSTSSGTGTSTDDRSIGDLNNDSVPTGDSTATYVVFAALIFSAAVIVFTRRKKNRG